VFILTRMTEENVGGNRLFDSESEVSALQVGTGRAQRRATPASSTAFFPRDATMMTTSARGGALC